MLLREDAHGVIAIGQPSHAWISGQIARAWGNERFGRFEPREEVCLAAEQHDAGMAAWDRSPGLNPDTGLPYSFIQMPLSAHLQAWREGPKRILAQSRYAALLVSMHGWRLYLQRDLDKLPRADADAVRAYMDEQRDFQEDLLATLRDDEIAASHADPELVARNSDLLWTWDFLSLALCLGWAPCRVRDVPDAGGWVEMHVLAGSEPGRVTLDPWPFATSSVKVCCEGQRLSGRYETDEALSEALEWAPWETVEFELVEPGATAT
jgi:hypothetical protein